MIIPLYQYISAVSYMYRWCTLDFNKNSMRNIFELWNHSYSDPRKILTLVTFICGFRCLTKCTRLVLIENKCFTFLFQCIEVLQLVDVCIEHLHNVSAILMDFLWYEEICNLNIRLFINKKTLGTKYLDVRKYCKIIDIRGLLIFIGPRNQWLLNVNKYTF